MEAGSLTLEVALAAIEPKPAMRTIDWARENGFTETGQPYSEFAYPHLSAPGGPFDAVDCDSIFDIWLQWASRLGKTFGGQIAMMKRADHEPCPMMFSSADEKLALEVVERTYGMLENCLPLRPRLAPPNRRKQSRIHLKICRVYVAWARSVSTLADKPVRFLHANEIDKWEHQSTSKEADPLKLADDRAKEFPTFKRWKEGTPALKTTSRVERGRLASCNADFWVPCPHCHRYQTLRMGDGTSPGGIIWEHEPNGRSDKDKAHKTARYVCKHCEKDVLDEHRGVMMRGGVWIPEGCGCDDEKALKITETWSKPGRDPWQGWKSSPWITGEPVRDGQDWGSKLSSLYALSRSWGDIAKEFVECKKTPQNLRNFVNQWLAETWEITRSKATWEQLGKRLIGNTPRFHCPAWAQVLTMGIDRQAEGGDRFPWIIVAWGAEYRCSAIAYGQADSLEEIESPLLAQQYLREGADPLRISFTLIDSGFRPNGIYEFCQKCRKAGREVWPSKGSSTALDSDFKRSVLGRNTSMPGMILYMIDTIRSQLWIEGILHSLDSTEGGSVYAGSLGDHQDFLEQLLNDAPVMDLDKHNNARESWDRINTSTPNDYRDCWRNAYVAMLIRTMKFRRPKPEDRPTPDQLKRRSA